MRRVDLRETDSHFETYMPRIRDPDNFDPRELASTIENTDDWIGKFTQVKYEYEYLKGYDSLGGFIEYGTMHPDIYPVQIGALIGDEILDLKVNNLVIEFITYNGNQ